MTSTSHSRLLLILVSMAALACGARVAGSEETLEAEAEEAEPLAAAAPDPCLATLYPWAFEDEEESCLAFSLLDPEFPPPGICGGCFCAQECETSVDCVPSLDGYAPNQCDPHGWCVLDCSELPCPDGMECITHTRWDRPLCHWVMTEDQEACDPDGG